MDPIKEAFLRAKQDIIQLKEQMSQITSSIEEIKRTLNNPTNTLNYPTSIQHSPTTPTDNLPLQALKSPNTVFSTGNRGVPTDRQTNQQTDRQTPSTGKSTSEVLENSTLAKLERVSKALASLDDAKQHLRTQFKRLTNQEMLVFSTIYQLQEEQIPVEYPLLASKLHLSESSVRDYVLKITRKGIPLLKSKEPNNKILLTIPSELQQMASLQTLLALREI